MKGHGYTIDDVRKTAESMGYELLSTKYIDSKSPLEFMCKEHGIFHQRYSRLKEGKGCVECRGLKKATYASRDFAIELAEKLGYELLDDNEIKLKKQKIKLRCPKHGVFWGSIDFLERGVGCPPCGTERMARKERTPYEVVKKAFEDSGKTLISTVYKEKHTPLAYICNKHPEMGIQYMSLHSVQKGEGCFKCGIEKRSGSNNVNWKGGGSDITSFLRGALFSWKMELFRQSGWRCSITGKQGTLNVHHLGVTFKDIAEKTFSDLKLDIRKNIGDYTEIEQNAIKAKLIENNASMAIPVVMLADVHRRFHSFCGGNLKPTSTEQLEEFKEQLKKAG